MINKFNIHINLTYLAKEIYNRQIEKLIMYSMNGIEIAIYIIVFKKGYEKGWH